MSQQPGSSSSGRLGVISQTNNPLSSRPELSGSSTSNRPISDALHAVSIAKAQGLAFGNIDPDDEGAFDGFDESDLETRPHPTDDDDDDHEGDALSELSRRNIPDTMDTSQPGDAASRGRSYSGLTFPSDSEGDIVPITLKPFDDRASRYSSNNDLDGDGDGDGDGDVTDDESEGSDIKAVRDRERERGGARRGISLLSPPPSAGMHVVDPLTKGNPPTSSPGIIPGVAPPRRLPAPFRDLVSLTTDVINDYLGGSLVHSPMTTIASEAETKSPQPLQHPVPHSTTQLNITSSSTTTTTATTSSSAGVKKDPLLAPRVAAIAVDKSWDALSEQAKHFAHWMSHAAWQGAIAVAHQVSYESPLILDLLLLVFGSSLATATQWRDHVLSSPNILSPLIPVTPADVDAFMLYAATFLNNLGNYRSFDGAKFTPQIHPAVFVEICLRAPSPTTKIRTTISAPPSNNNTTGNSNTNNNTTTTSSNSIVSNSTTSSTSSSTIINSLNNWNNNNNNTNNKSSNPSLNPSTTAIGTNPLSSLSTSHPDSSPPIPPPIPSGPLTFLASSLVTDEQTSSLRSEISHILTRCLSYIYSTGPSVDLLGFPGDGTGVSGYYSSTVTSSNVVEVDDFLLRLNLSPYNTRLFRRVGNKFTLALFSAMPRVGCTYRHSEQCVVEVTFEDVAPGALRALCTCLQLARGYASDHLEGTMVDSYLKHFLCGDVEDHISAQRQWMKSKPHAVETNLGFIESYRDAAGTRGEFEGFVLLSSPRKALLYNAVNNHYQYMASLMPWPKVMTPPKPAEFAPAFRALDVLSFAGSSVLSGANIPNYASIRDTIGYKDLWFSNVRCLVDTTCLTLEMRLIYAELGQSVYEVLEALKQAMGPATSYLLRVKWPEPQTNSLTLPSSTSSSPPSTSDNADDPSSDNSSDSSDDDSDLERSRDNIDQSPSRSSRPPPVATSSDTPIALNFDPTATHPTTGLPLIWYGYAEHESFHSKFGDASAAYEEVRSLLVALRLLMDPAVLNFSGYTSSQHPVVAQAAFAWVVCRAIEGLLDYSDGHWLSAWSQASFVVASLLHEHGLLKIELGVGEAGFTVHFSSGQVLVSEGLRPISVTLYQLHMHRVLGEGQEGTAIFSALSTLTPIFADVRSILLARRRQPRLIVQPHTYIDPVDSTVRLVTYDASVAGVIDSFMARYVKSPPTEALVMGFRSRRRITPHPLLKADIVVSPKPTQPSHSFASEPPISSHGTSNSIVPNPSSNTLSISSSSSSSLGTTLAITPLKPIAGAPVISADVPR